MPYCPCISGDIKPIAKEYERKKRLETKKGKKKISQTKKPIYKFTGIYSFQRRETN